MMREMEEVDGVKYVLGTGMRGRRRVPEEMLPESDALAS